MGFGGFTQGELSVSGYLAARHGDIWFDTVATYGAISYDVARTVPVGITVQNNTAKTAGSDISLAAETGYDFHFGKVAHGPVAGMTLQQVHVDGFTESGSFTSLGFGSQTRNSAVADFGYRLIIDYGRWTPFARATWDHEFASTNRQVAALLTTSAAPFYSMPAVTSDADWGVLTAGTRLKIAADVTGLLAFTGTVAQQNVTTYGGQIGVNVSF